MPDISLPHEELRATLEARRDLGPAYEDALVESFLEKLDQEISARVRAEVAAHSATPPAKTDNSHIPVALGSLGIAIPLTAIAGANDLGTIGFITAWGSIVIINVAYALGRRRR